MRAILNKDSVDLVFSGEDLPMPISGPFDVVEPDEIILGLGWPGAPIKVYWGDNQYSFALYGNGCAEAMRWGERAPRPMMWVGTHWAYPT